MFPQALAMSQSWNRSLVRAVAAATSAALPSVFIASERLAFFMRTLLGSSFFTSYGR